MKKNRTKDFAVLTVGVVAGMMLAPTAASAAAQLFTATPSTQRFYLDGQPVQLEAYSINGSNYVKLRDVGQAVNFGVSYDVATNAVQINTKTGYTPEVKSTSDAQYIPQAGDVIRCTDGTDYTIRDVSRYTVVGALPAATCDWSRFPAVELPEAEAQRRSTQSGDYLFLRNLHETRRMQYTLYNAIGETPEVWQNGKPVLRSDGSPRTRVELRITDTDYAQSFWPWRESQITDGFANCATALYQMEAWDVFKDGVFLYTEYMVSVVI